MVSESSKKKSAEESRKEVRDLFIRFLMEYSVREDLILPILFVVSRSEMAMLHLMVFLKETNPTEEELIEEMLHAEKLYILKEHQPTAPAENIHT